MKKVATILISMVCAMLALMILVNSVILPLVQSGSRTSDKKEVSFTTAGHITVYSFQYKQMENGKIRYFLDVTIPETDEILVYDTPSGQVFSFKLLIPTTAGRQTIVFEIDEKNVAKVDMFAVRFSDQSRPGKDMWIYVTTNQSSADKISAPTDAAVQTQPTVPAEPPDPDCQKVSFTTAGDITVHGLWDQQLENGQIRYTLDVTAPKGRTVTILDTVYENAYGTPFNVQPVNGKHIDIQLTASTSEGRQTIVFDLDADKVANADRLTVRFGYINDHSKDANIYVKPNKYDGDSASVRTETAGEAQNQVGFSTAGKITVHSFLQEQQRNGSIRFTLDVTASAGRTISVFGTATGKEFHLTLPEKTTEGRQTIFFDLWPSQVSRFTVNFKKPEATTADLWIYAIPKL